jgi:hypothetical protein
MRKSQKEMLKQQMAEALAMAKEYHFTFQNLRKQLKEADDKDATSLRTSLSAVVRAWKAEVDKHNKLEADYKRADDSPGTYDGPSNSRSAPN